MWKYDNFLNILVALCCRADREAEKTIKSWKLVLANDVREFVVVCSIS